MKKTTFALGDKKKISITGYMNNVYIHINSISNNKQISLSKEEYESFLKLGKKITKGIEKEMKMLRKKGTKRSKSDSESEEKIKKKSKKSLSSSESEADLSESE